MPKQSKTRICIGREYSDMTGKRFYCCGARVLAFALRLLDKRRNVVRWKSARLAYLRLRGSQIQATFRPRFEFHLRLLIKVSEMCRCIGVGRHLRSAREGTPVDLLVVKASKTRYGEWGGHRSSVSEWSNTITRSALDHGAARSLTVRQLRSGRKADDLTVASNDVVTDTERTGIRRGLEQKRTIPLLETFSARIVWQTPRDSLPISGTRQLKMPPMTLILPVSRAVQLPARQSLLISSSERLGMLGSLDSSEGVPSRERSGLQPPPASLGASTVRMARLSRRKPFAIFNEEHLAASAETQPHHLLVANLNTLLRQPASVHRYGGLPTIPVAQVFARNFPPIASRDHGIRSRATGRSRMIYSSFQVRERRNLRSDSSEYGVSDPRASERGERLPSQIGEMPVSERQDYKFASGWHGNRPLGPAGEPADTDGNRIHNWGLLGAGVKSLRFATSLVRSAQRTGSFGSTQGDMRSAIANRDGLAPLRLGTSEATGLSQAISRGRIRSGISNQYIDVGQGSTSAGSSVLVHTRHGAVTAARTNLDRMVEEPVVLTADSVKDGVTNERELGGTGIQRTLDPTAIPARELQRLSQRVYELIVDRVRRERERSGR